MPLVICRQGRRGSRGQSWWVESPQRENESRWDTPRLLQPLPPLSQRNANHATLCLPVSRLYSVFPVACWKPLKAGCYSLLCLRLFFYDPTWASNSLGRWCPETLSMQLSFHAAVQLPYRLAEASFHNNSALAPWHQTLPGYRSACFHHLG